MKRTLAAVFCAALSIGAANAQELRDLPSDNPYSGSSKSASPDANGTYRVYDYQWVCPSQSDRPPSGRVVIYLPNEECVSKDSKSVVPASGAACMEATPQDETTRITTIQLDTYECFSQATRSVVAMEKRYASSYYIVGGDESKMKNGGDESQYSNQNGGRDKAKQSGNAAGGKFSDCTPNPFLLCSGPKPPREEHQKRACYEELCE